MANTSSNFLRQLTVRSSMDRLINNLHQKNEKKTYCYHLLLFFEMMQSMTSMETALVNFSESIALFFSIC